MRKYIQRYLSEKYYITKSSAGNQGIYLLSDKDSIYLYPINGSIISKELNTLFGIEKEEAKLEIHLWSVKISPYQNLDLDFYWEHNSKEPFLGAHMLPIAMHVTAQTIGMDLVPVVPMDGPKMNLVYLDYVYGIKNKSFIERLWDKLITFVTSFKSKRYLL